MAKRVSALLVLALLSGAVAAYLLKPETGVPDGAPTESAMAADLGAPIMELIFKGHVKDRSGEILLVPKPHSYIIGEWDLTTLGTDQPTTANSHPNPWNYLTRVPIIAYGPGYVEPGTYDDEVDIADIAPSFASVLGVELEAQGSPLGAIPPSPKKLPKVIFTVVIDGGGWNALQMHPDSVPTIDRLRSEGATYVNATIGSAPSITGALHATFGTGSYPQVHGLPGNQMRDPEGDNVDTWLQNADPRYLEVPTVSELWDEQQNNKPVVATVSYEGWHLGMIGHGAQREGGDKDVAALWEAKDDGWFINEDYYELPPFLVDADLATLESYEEELDARDGLTDGLWFDKDLEVLQEPLVRPGSPAFTRFTGDAIIDTMREYEVGKDDITDMFWVEMKMPDYAGHAWNVTNPEQGDVLRETDAQIARMLAELDKTVGKGNYLFVVSADHGQQPLADLNGGWRINSKELDRDIDARFGGNVVEKVTPVDIYLDRELMAEKGIDPGDVARFIGSYTIGDNIPVGAPGAERVPEARLDETLFAGAFSSGFLESLSLDSIVDFGDGKYPEGDLTINLMPASSP